MGERQTVNLLPRQEGSIPSPPTKMTTWNDPLLEAALNKCRQTHSGKVPDHGRDYLLARHEYHRLLVERGWLDQDLAERKPK